MAFRSNATALALGSTLAISHSAAAAFISLQVTTHAVVNTGGGQKTVYRVYARFSEGSDEVAVWSGNATNPTVLATRRCNNVPGLAFYQAPLGLNTAPTQSAINNQPDTQWDTFATIGVSVADQGSGPPGSPDETFYGPFAPTFINGNQITLNNTAVATLGSTPQARADYAGDGDPQLRVLLMQLTVDVQDRPTGTIGRLQWRSGTGVITTLTNLTWEPAAAYGICCLPSGCVNTFQSTCAQSGGKYLGCAECADCARPCEADIDGSGAVDVDDLIAVILGWGPCPGKCAECAADTDGTCVVDVDDLVAVILNWGPCS